MRQIIFLSEARKKVKDGYNDIVSGKKTLDQFDPETQGRIQAYSNGKNVVAKEIQAANAANTSLAKEVTRPQASQDRVHALGTIAAQHAENANVGKADGLAMKQGTAKIPVTDPSKIGSGQKVQSLKGTIYQGAEGQLRTNEIKQQDQDGKKSVAQHIYDTTVKTTPAKPAEDASDLQRQDYAKAKYREAAAQQIGHDQFTAAQNRAFQQGAGEVKAFNRASRQIVRTKQ